ncbi:hypothetical protein HK405_004290, partial [Cladochytrium tenue]
MAPSITAAYAPVPHDDAVDRTSASDARDAYALTHGSHFGDHGGEGGAEGGSKKEQPCPHGCEHHDPQSDKEPAHGHGHGHGHSHGHNHGGILSSFSRFLFGTQKKASAAGTHNDDLADRHSLLSRSDIMDTSGLDIFEAARRGALERVAHILNDEGASPNCREPD